MRRTLGLFDVTCIGLNAIVGSGIFALPDDVFREMGVLSPLAFLLCAVGLLPVALCYAEAASGVDRTGGPYVYTHRAFGPFAGFVVGWMCFANAVFSFAAVSQVAASYLAKLLPFLSGTVEVKAVAVGLIVVFAALNYRGSRPGSSVINVFTIGKFAVLFILLAVLAPHVTFEHRSTALPRGWAGVGAATFITLFAVQGFEVAPVPAGETRAPERTVPIALVTALLAASALYLLVQLTLVGAYDGLATVSDTPIANAARAVAPWAEVVLIAGGLISTLGFVSGSALGTPRYLYAAAVDGHLHRSLAKVHASYESPHRAIIVTALLSVALAVPFDYRQLIGMSNVSVAVQYLGTCLAVLRLRHVGAAAKFKIPGGPVVPVLGALVSASVFAAANREELAWAGASLAVGLIALAVSSRRPVPA